MTGDVAAMMGMPFIMLLILGLAEIGVALLMLWGGFGPARATQLGVPIFREKVNGSCAIG